MVGLTRPELYDLTPSEFWNLIDGWNAVKREKLYHLRALIFHNYRAMGAKIKTPQQVFLIGDEIDGNAPPALSPEKEADLAAKMDKYMKRKYAKKTG